MNIYSICIYHILGISQTSRDGNKEIKAFVFMKQKVNGKKNAQIISIQ